MKLSIKNKFYLQIGLSIVVFLVFVFYSWHTFSILVSESLDYKESKKELFELEEKGKKDKTAMEKIELFKSDIELIDSSFLSRDNELDFIILVEDIARKNLLNHDINIIEEQGKKRLKKKKGNIMKFKVDLSGDFNGVLNFIKSIENLKYYSNITNLDLERISGKSNSLENDYPLDDGDVKASMMIELVLF